jgi:putative addiction module component (TIGR02574 family)
MATTIDRTAIKRMSVDERLKLMDLIWDTLVEQDADIPLSKDVLEEMEWRLADAQAHPEQSIPFDEFERRLKERWGGSP